MKFTYGFEIEGRFKSLIFQKLLKSKGITEIGLKDDGSVECYDNNFIDRLDENTIIGKLRAKKIKVDYDDDTQLREITIGIFRRKEDLFDVLDVFDKKTYYYNETCGLHLHIKPIKPEISYDFKSYVLVKKLAKFIKKELCQECQNRIVGYKYCQQYTTMNQTFSDFWRKEKYKIMRVHPSGTFEFRFLSPCEHKTENVKKLLSFIEKTILSLKTLQKNTTIGESKMLKLNQNLNLGKISPISQKIEICV